MTSVRQHHGRDSLVRWAALLAGLGAVAAAVWLVRPLGPVIVGSDSASSVLYFERLIHGESLERFLGTTPKPLLTVIYGLVHGATGDWRAVGWLAIAVHAAAVGSTALLAGRVAGASAAAFAGAGLIANAWFTQDVTLALAQSWALLAVAGAALALDRPRPRWLLAGGLLAAGTLARQEVLLVTAGAAAVLAGALVVPPLRRRVALRGLAVLVGAAVVAIPLSAAHDWLLTGDALYSLRVPALGAEGRDVRSLAGTTAFLGRHMWAQAPFLLLAFVGAAALVAARRWWLLGGLAFVAMGIGGFFLLVAARGFVPLDRYIAPVDAAVIVAASIGFASLRLSGSLRRALRGLRAPAPATVRRAGPWLAPAAAVVTVAMLAPTIGPLDRELVTRARTQRAVATDWQAALPALRRGVQETPVLRTPPALGDASSRDVARPAVLVSAGLLPMAAVDLDLRLDRIARLESVVQEPADLVGWEGSILFHVAGFDTGGDTLVWLQVDRFTVIGPIALEPLDVQAGRSWLLRVVRAP